MKIWRGLRTRIVFGSILCGMLGVVVSWAMIRRTVREAIQSGFAPSVYRTLDHGELDRCQRDPAHWTTRIGRGARLDAYDEGKLASENRDSPPLDKALYGRLVSGERSPIKYLRLGSAEATTMLVRAADNGPCALVQVTWPPHPSARRRWTMVTVRKSNAGESVPAFYDLPALRAARELVLNVPRVGFFSTPAFFCQLANQYE